LQHARVVQVNLARGGILCFVITDSKQLMTLKVPDDLHFLFRAQESTCNKIYEMIALTIHLSHQYSLNADLLPNYWDFQKNIYSEPQVHPQFHR
jgi:hypothetical protein